MFLFTIPQASERPDLEAWMEQYGTQLLRLCFLYLNDHQFAEDAVQETFVKAYFKYSTFRGEASVGTWLTAIAVNVCRDLMRRSAYRERPLVLGQGDDPELAMERRLTDRQQTDPMDEADERMVLLQAVSQLPLIYRETILLYYYNGLTAKQIASALHCALPTVNVRLKRGRELLKKAISDGRKEE